MEKGDSQRYTANAGAQSIYMKPGDAVRVISAPDRIGALSRFEMRGETKRWFVRFGQTGDWYPESNLEVMAEEESLYDLVRAQRFGRTIHLRKAITNARLTGRLAEVIYSMEATNTDFYAYQFKPVLNVLESTSDGILIADEVGLGKTIEAGLIWTELVARQNCQNLLVVCPASLCKKWQDELRDRFGVRADICNSSELLEKLHESTIHGYELAAIISIQGMRRQNSKLNELIEENAPNRDLFDCVIIDEAHHMRNTTTQTHRLGTLLRSVTKNLILLSATPIQLRNDDLFHLLKIIDEENFEEKNDFDQMIQLNRPILEVRKLLIEGQFSQSEFNKRINDCLALDRLRNNRQLKALQENPPTQEFLQDINKRVQLANRIERINALSNIISRTRKRDVKERRVIREPKSIDVLMTEREMAIYNKITDEIYDFCEHNYTSNRANFFVIIPQRQLCSSIPAAVRRWQKLGGMDIEDPDADAEVFDSVRGTSIDNESRTSGTLTKELIHISKNLGNLTDLKQNDSKYKMLIESLTRYWQDYPEKKVIVFAYYRFTLEYLKERLDEEGIKSVLMMGGMSSDEKKQGIARFRDDKQIKVLLTSETLSEGVDLQFSSVLINYDLPWNPMKVEQRIGRIDRIGQKEERIEIHNLFYKDTLDDRIYERLYKRLDIFREALGDLEAVLGEKITELSYQLISHRLTPKQQEEQIEQTAIALANQKEQQEELESKAGDLTAHGDYILNKVKAAESLKRFIQGKDLWIYTRDFLTENYPGCALVQENDDSMKIKVELSLACKQVLRIFLEDSPRLRTKTKLHTTRSGEGTECYFENQMDRGEPNYEVINQQHPLIQFISSKSTQIENRYQLVATQLKGDHFESCEEGIYLVLIQRWSTKSAKESESLVYRCLNLVTREVQSDDFAERIILASVNYGKDWPSANTDIDPNLLDSGYVELDNTVAEDFTEHCDYMKLENEDRIDTIINTINDQHEKHKFNLQKQINKVQAGSANQQIIRMHEGNIRNDRLRADARIEEYESKRGHVSTEDTDIAFVAVNVT